MRRRYLDESQGSLDLLLDTITNAFGGIVLLSLLVVLLVSQSGPVRTRQSQPVAADSSQQVAELSHRRDQLRLARETQQLVDSRFATQETATLAHQIEQLQTQITTASDEMLELQADVRQASEHDSRREQKLTQLHRAIELAKADDKEVENRLDQERGKRRVTLDLPKESPIYKIPVVFVVRYGELFQLDRSLGKGRFKLNTDHFQNGADDPEIILASDRVRAASKRGRGLSLGSLEALDDLVSRIDADTHYATYCVWSDSFEDFGVIRTACIAAGLKYRVIPVFHGPIVETAGVAGAQ